MLIVLQPHLDFLPPPKKKIPATSPGAPNEFGLGLGWNPKAYVVRLQERSGLFEVLELEVAAAAWFVGFFAPTKKTTFCFQWEDSRKALDICIVSRNLPRGCYYCRFQILYHFGVGFLVLEIKPFGICGMFGSSRISVRVLVWPNNRSC